MSIASFCFAVKEMWGIYPPLLDGCMELRYDICKLCSIFLHLITIDMQI